MQLHLLAFGSANGVSSETSSKTAPRRTGQSRLQNPETARIRASEVGGPSDLRRAEDLATRRYTKIAESVQKIRTLSLHLG